MTGGSKHRVHLGNSINRRPKPLHGLGSPTPEGLNGERDQATSREKPSRIPSVLPVRSPGSRSSISVGCGVEPGAALWVRHHNVAVHEWV